MFYHGSRTFRPKAHKLIASLVCLPLIFMGSLPAHAHCLKDFKNDYSSVVKNGVLFFVSAGAFAGVLAQTVIAGIKCAEYEAQINGLSYTDPATGKIIFQCHPDCYYPGNCIGQCSPSWSDAEGCQAYLSHCLNLTNSRGPWLVGAVVGGLLASPILYGAMCWGRHFLYHCQDAIAVNNARQRGQDALAGLCPKTLIKQESFNQLKDFYHKNLMANPSFKLSLLDTLLYLEKGIETDELCPGGYIMDEERIVKWLSQQSPLEEENYKSFVEAMKHSDSAYELVALHAYKNEEAITLRDSIVKDIGSPDEQDESDDGSLDKNYESFFKQLTKEKAQRSIASKQKHYRSEFQEQQ